MHTCSRKNIGFSRVEKNKQRDKLGRHVFKREHCYLGATPVCGQGEKAFKILIPGGWIADSIGRDYDLHARDPVLFSASHSPLSTPGAILIPEPGVAPEPPGVAQKAKQDISSLL